MILLPLWAKVFKSETPSFRYFSPRILKIYKVLTLDFWKWEKRPLNGVRNNDTKKILLIKAKFAQKHFFCAAILPPKLVKFSSLRPLLYINFSQGFRISNFFATSGSGGKKTFKWYLKKLTDKQTDEQTDRWTDGRIFQIIEGIGPEGLCFEN